MATISRSISASIDWPPSSAASSAIASRSLSLAASPFQSRSARSIDAFSLRTVFALSELFQNPDVSVRLVSSASFASLAGVSKMPPQGLKPAVNGIDLLFQVFQKHGVLLIFLSAKDCV
jgi:hypothetical protein